MDRPLRPRRHRVGLRALCVAATLDEFGGPADETSALNLVYLLGQDASTDSGAQPRGAPQLAGADEKWHIHGGNDQLITGILSRLPRGALHLGQRLVAVRPNGPGYRCSFDRGGTVRDVTADHVVLALPFTVLRSVDLRRAEISPLHRRAIREEPLGTNSKIFMQYGSRVWNAAGTTGNCFDDGVVQGGWDATSRQAGPAGILAALPGGRSAADWGRRYGLASARATCTSPASTPPRTTRATSRAPCAAATAARPRSAPGQARRPARDLTGASGPAGAR